MDAIVAKVWLIGRLYAASIEWRRIEPIVTGDDFYVNEVAPAMMRFGIDRWFDELRELWRPDATAVIPCAGRCRNDTALRPLFRRQYLDRPSADVVWPSDRAKTSRWRMRSCETGIPRLISSMRRLC